MRLSGSVVASRPISVASRECENDACANPQVKPVSPCVADMSLTTRHIGSRDQAFGSQVRQA